MANRRNGSEYPTVPAPSAMQEIAKIGPQRNQPKGHWYQSSETILQIILRVLVSVLIRRAGAGPVCNRAIARGRGIHILSLVFTLTNAHPLDGGIGPTSAVVEWFKFRKAVTTCYVLVSSIQPKAKVGAT